MRKFLLGLSLVVYSSLALAHPGHGSGFLPGFLHPFTGFDHLLVMISVGLWAGSNAQKFKIKLPSIFILLMALGAFVGSKGINFPWLETSLSASLIAMGLLLVIRSKFPISIQIALMGMFGLLHGMAHGQELSSEFGLMTIIGMLLASSLLQLLGIFLSSKEFGFSKRFKSILALTMVGLGIVNLFA